MSQLPEPSHRNAEMSAFLADVSRLHTRNDIADAWACKLLSELAEYDSVDAVNPDDFPSVLRQPIRDAQTTAAARGVVDHGRTLQLASVLRFTDDTPIGDHASSMLISAWRCSTMYSLCAYEVSPGSYALADDTTPLDARVVVFLEGV